VLVQAARTTEQARTYFRGLCGLLQIRAGDIQKPLGESPENLMHSAFKMLDGT